MLHSAKSYSSLSYEIVGLESVALSLFQNAHALYFSCVGLESIFIRSSWRLSLIEENVEKHITKLDCSEIH